MSMDTFFAALGGLPPGWTFAVTGEFVRTVSADPDAGGLCPLQAVYRYETGERVTCFAFTHFANHFDMTVDEVREIMQAADEWDEETSPLRARLLTACKLDRNPKP